MEYYIEFHIYEIPTVPLSFSTSYTKSRYLKCMVSRNGCLVLPYEMSIYLHGCEIQEYLGYFRKRY